MRRLLIGTLAAMAAVLDGCNTAPPPSQALREAPAAANNVPNPLAGNQDAAAAGHQLYLDYCASCHGRYARGGPATALISTTMRDAAPGRIAYVLEHGAPARGMPPWTQLTATQRWQIVTWLATVQDR